MNTTELKFLLKLLGFEDYKTSLSKIQLNKSIKPSEKEKTCRDLCTRELVDCSYEVTKLKIAPPGKALLKLDSTQLPLIDQELKVLRACAKGAISPGKTGVSVEQRQSIIQGLADRGLIELETKIKEVWLSKRGQEYLRDDYTSKGTYPTLSLDMLNNYLRFLRKSLRVETLQTASLSDGVFTQEAGTETLTAEPSSQLSNEEILQTIRDLDRQLGTNNYLPIFHLREKLQPPLSRENLDQALYQLQRNDLIELSSLQEESAYTQEQINAGIPQDIGGSLFFIIVN